MIEILALTRTNIEGTLVVVMAVVLFCGSVYLLLSAVFGLRMAYLVAATGLFAFMIILSAIWAFGARDPEVPGAQGEAAGLGGGGRRYNPPFSDRPGDREVPPKTLEDAG